MKDCNYNILHALVKEQQGLYAIAQYLKDAKKEKHSECENAWKKIEKNKTENVKLLHKIMAEKIKNGEC